MTKAQKISIALAVICIIGAVLLSVRMAKNFAGGGKTLFTAEIESVSETEIAGLRVNYKSGDFKSSFYAGFSDGNIKKGDVLSVSFYESDFPAEITQFSFSVEVNLSGEEYYPAEGEISVVISEGETAKFTLSEEDGNFFLR